MSEFLTQIEKKADSFLASTLTANEASEEQMRTVRLGIQRTEFLMFEEGVSIHGEFLPGNPAKNSFFGAYSYINPASYFRGNVFVGRFCSIGRRVSIGAGSHLMDHVSTSSFFRGGGRKYSEDELSQVATHKGGDSFTIIGNDVWIGDGVIIAPGVRIGDGAVLGANAVVIKDVPPYAVMGGVPAKLLKTRFSQSVVDNLLDSKWWNVDKTYLEKLPTGNVFEFLELLDTCQSAYYETWC